MRYLLTLYLFFCIYFLINGNSPGADNKLTEAQAIIEIEKVGGIVKRDPNQPIYPVIYVSLLSDKEHQVSDGTLSYMSALKHLQYFEIVCLSPKDCRITDAGMAHIKDLLSIRSLRLVGIPISNKGLQNINIKGCHWALQNQPPGGASKPASCVHVFITDRL